MSTKQLVKEQFKQWAKGKTLDEIADKFYEAISQTYDLTKQKCAKDMIEKVMEQCK